MAKKKKVSQGKKVSRARVARKKKAKAPRAQGPRRKKAKKAKTPGRKRSQPRADKPARRSAVVVVTSVKSVAPAPQPPPPEAEKRELVFTPAEGSAKNVRVTLDGDEVVLAGGVSTPSRPRANGEEVPVLIEVIGNKGEKGIVNVTNSKPGQLTTPPIAAGSTGVRDPRLIEVKFT